MDEDTLKKLIEGMVRDALAANEADIKVPGKTGSDNLRKPLYNFKMNINKERMIAANWKMNMTKAEAKEFAAQVSKINIDNKEVIICPPIYLAPMLTNALIGTGIRIGAQNMHHEDRGAFTSEISPVMVKDAGCDFVILGHSERRHIFSEKDHAINLKVIAAINHGIIPIFCVGETLEQREAGETLSVLGDQIKNSIPPGVSGDQYVVAYEPVWAIGTGLVPETSDIDTAHNFLRSKLKEIGVENADKVRLLYGGSVKPGNAAELLSLADVDGGLVGGASLSADDFWAIATAAG